MELETERKLSLSQSVYGKLNEMMNKSPLSVIVSVCALFIVLLLCLTIPLYFPTNNTTKSSC